MSQVLHEHDLERGVPDRLPPEVVRRLSALQPARALLALASDWLSIGVTIALCELLWHPALYACAVIWIGSRQHALAVLVHDASHWRLLPDRRWNDAIGNLFAAWPTFSGVAGYRHFHGAHHRHLNREGDGNRTLWSTHDAQGRLRPDWRYPKTFGGLIATLLKQCTGLAGARWIVGGILGMFFLGRQWWLIALRSAFFIGAAALLDASGRWSEFFMYWIVPYATWHALTQHLRLICEHSAIPSSDPHYGHTRSTLPGRLERLLLLPRNIGYHIEHHDYPSVPYYHLPQLHAALMQQPRFRENAVIRKSVRQGLAECVTA